MKRFLNLDIFKSEKFIFWSYAIITIVASIHRYWLGENHINNYLIFKTSFQNLIHNIDLYIPHAEKYYDLYKYSPTFSVLMAPFYLLPNFLGIIFWNLLNSLTLFIAIKKLPSIDIDKKYLIYWFVLLELLTSIQNSQSNGLVAALMLLSFVSFEKNNSILASLFLTLCFYIKIFGIAPIVLFLMYPNKIKFIMYMLFWSVLLLLLPLIFTSASQLIYQYESWFNMLRHDQSHELNFSIMKIFDSWFNLSLNNLLFQILGLAILLIPLFNFKFYKIFNFRVYLFSSILIWVIIFNHKAESATFIIAILGVVLWYMIGEKNNTQKFLLLFALVLTSLSPTDLFPKYIRDNIIVPYALKALPCIIIWLMIQYELYLGKFKLIKV